MEDDEESQSSPAALDSQMNSPGNFISPISTGTAFRPKLLPKLNTKTNTTSPMN